MALVFTLTDPTGTITDVSTGPHALCVNRNYPDLIRTLEDEKGQISVGDVTVDFRNHDGWYDTQFAPSNVNPEAHWDETLGYGIWNLSISKGGAVVWTGDIDPQSITFDTKHGFVSATFFGILKRFERFNAEKVFRVDNDALLLLKWKTNKSTVGLFNGLAMRPRVAALFDATGTTPVPIASVGLMVLDHLAITKLQSNGHLTNQDMEILHVGPGTFGTTVLLSNEVQFRKRLKVDLNNAAGVSCSTPGWRGLSFGVCVGKLLDYCGIAAGARSINYTPFSPDVVPYLDTKGKNVLDTLSELAADVGACLFRTPTTTYFQGRDLAKAGATPKNIDALWMEESRGVLWSLFRYLITVKSNVKQRTKRRGGLVYPKNELEVSTDFTDDTSVLALIADRLYSWFGMRRVPIEWTLKDDGTAYQIWDSLVRTIGGVATTFYVTEVAEPLRSVDPLARSSIKIKAIAATGTAPSTGDGESDDQYIDDLDPEPPYPLEIYKVGHGEPAMFRTLYPADKYPTTVYGTPVLVGNTLTLPKRHLFCIRFRWDNDDLAGRLLGFHLTKCHQDGDISKKISEDRLLDLDPASDGWWYWAPRSAGTGNGGPAYIEAGKKRTYFLQTVLEDGRVSAQSDEIDSWITGGVDDSPPDGGCFYLSANFTTGGVYRLLGGVWTLVTGIRAMDLGSYFACARGKQSGYLLVQTYPAPYASSAAWSKSVDGASWQELIPPAGYEFPTPSAPQSTFAYLAVCPGNDAYIMAEAYMDGTADYTMFLSPDGGQTWQPGYTFVSQMVKLIIGTYDPQVWYAITQDGHLRHTVDGGATWADHGAITCIRIIAHPYAAGTIIQIGNGIIALSSDYGATFGANICPTGFTGEYYDLAIDPSDADHWIVVARYGSYPVIFNSSDGLATTGASWVPVSGLTGKEFYKVEFDPTNPSIVYAAGCEYGSPPDVLYISQDGGLTFAANNPPSNWDTLMLRFDILAVPGSGTTPPQTSLPCYAEGYVPSLTTRSLWVSTDSCTTEEKVWSDDSVIMAGPYVALAREPSDASGLTVYRADEGNAVKVSCDGGQSWAQWLARGSLWTKIVLFPSSTVAFVVTKGGKLFRTLTRTNNFPNDWVNVAPPRVTVVSAACNPATPTTLYVLGSDGKVYTSTNATALPPTWDAGQTTGFSAGNAAEIICPGTGVLWVVGTRQVIGTSTVIRHSTNGGATWSNPTDPDAAITSLGIQQIYSDAAGNLFVLSSNGHYGIWRSTDLGSTWTAVYGGSTDANTKCYCIAPIAGVTGGLFAGRQVGILKSTNSGATWAGAGDTGDTLKKFLSVC